MEEPISFPIKAPRIKFISTDPLEILSTNRVVASPFQISKHKKDAARNWDVFYKSHKDGFFGDRHWLEKEFDVIRELEMDDAMMSAEAGKGKGKVVLEVGCGTGAFLYPLLERTKRLKVHAFDFSPRAVDLVKQNARYDPARVHAFVHDLTDATTPLQQKLDSAPAAFHSFASAIARTDSDEVVEATPPTPSTSSSGPDLISCIFVLSALPPKTHLEAVKSLLRVLAPSGTLILRDYAVLDQAQLRFHALPSASYTSVPSLLSRDRPSSSATNSEREGREEKAEEEAEEEDDGESGRHWYRRGDGTLCYFFGVEEMNALMEKAVFELNEEAMLSGGVPILGGEVRRWKLFGEAVLIEKEMMNRREGWGCTRRFVQGDWKKVWL